MAAREQVSPKQQANHDDDSQKNNEAEAAAAAAAAAVAARAQPSPQTNERRMAKETRAETAIGSKANSCLGVQLGIDTAGPIYYCSSCITYVCVCGGFSRFARYLTYSADFRQVAIFYG